MRIVNAVRLSLAVSVLVVCAAAGVYLLPDLRIPTFRVPEPPAEASTQAIEAEVAGAHFAYAPALARDDATAAGGAQERLAFVVHFPDFGPAPRLEKPQDAAKARAERVLVTVATKDDSPNPADRPSQLYARFLESEASVGPEGLVMRRFEQGSPYDLEQLYIAPPDGRDFFARCPKAVEENGAGEEFCLFVFRDGSIDVELRFAPALLEQWPALAEGARGFVARIKTGARSQ